MTSTVVGAASSFVEFVEYTSTREVLLSVMWSVSSRL